MKTIESNASLTLMFSIPNGTIFDGDGAPSKQSDLARMILSDDPRIWQPWPLQ